jgi:mono/diheme cytochrome c family protein/glucose/arabinose dehydrogenase
MTTFLRASFVFISILGISSLLTSCTSSTSKPYPVVSLPKDAKPDDPNWKDIDLAPKPPVTPLKPEEEQKKFLLPPGYSIEPVLTDPKIEQPAAISFDGNGRMYVLELRSYMLTADSDHELDPVSGISRWEDKDNDGIYETGTMFVDKLVFPRFVLPFGANSILTMESNADNVYQYTDTDKDGVADKKELFTTSFGRAGNVEHQQAFLYWGMDNWMYSSVNAFRVRWTPNGVLREPTGANRAQWGVTQDDDGKIWFQGGASGVPSYFQFPIHYGNFIVEDQYAKGFDIPWGAPVLLADMQGGMDEVRQPDGSLNHVTGSAGNDVFRGNRLPANMEGQYFYGEPVARIVRQVNPIVTEGVTQLHNYFQDWKSEFVRSTDPLFRPVDLATAPDGTMYVVDMYHGIIQEGQWTQRDTYLRTKIEQYQLDKVIGLGRIWRIKYDGIDRDHTQPHMLDETPAQLVAHLEHPNGWWRDMAQQLLVVRQDKSVVPALKEIAMSSKNLLARFHALWTLEGLGALDAELIQTLIKDPSPRLRIQVLRASETLYKAGDKSFVSVYKNALKDPDTDVLIQAMLTASLLKVPDVFASIKAIKSSNHARGVQLVAEQILTPPVVNGFGIPMARKFTPEQKVLVEHGLTIYNELCSTCHGNNGTGTPSGDKLIAPSLASSDRVQGHPDYVLNVLLHGLTGQIEGKSYAGEVMVPMAQNSDEWIASVATFIRTNFTNNASPVTVADVARVRKETAGQTKPYSYPELTAVVPQPLEIQSTWQVTSSHSVPTKIGGTASTLGAFSFEGWTTGIGQEPGMWFQIAFPSPQKLAQIEFVSAPNRRGFGPKAPPPIETYPRDYVVQVSSDGKTWTPIAEGKASNASTTVQFKPVETKFLRILLAGAKNESPWSMQQLTLFGWK